jgi:ribonuclease HI
MEYVLVSGTKKDYIKKSSIKKKCAVPPKKVTITVYTDGSCEGNGKKNSRGGMGVYFPEKFDCLEDISERFTEPYPTNQKTELLAIKMALDMIDETLGLSKVNVVIKTDSKYSIDCITKWSKKWSKNGWKKVDGKSVLNQEYIIPIYQLWDRYGFVMEHVPAHTGGSDIDSKGNEVADMLATAASKKENNVNIIVELLGHRTN